jgi:hypothetical protein
MLIKIQQTFKQLSILINEQGLKICRTKTFRLCIMLHQHNFFQESQTFFLYQNQNIMGIKVPMVIICYKFLTLGLHSQFSNDKLKNIFINMGNTHLIEFHLIFSLDQKFLLNLSLDRKFN